MRTYDTVPNWSSCVTRALACTCTWCMAMRALAELCSAKCADEVFYFCMLSTVQRVHSCTHMRIARWPRVCTTFRDRAGGIHYAYKRMPPTRIEQRRCGRGRWGSQPACALFCSLWLHSTVQCCGSRPAVDKRASRMELVLQTEQLCFGKLLFPEPGRPGRCSQSSLSSDITLACSLPPKASFRVVSATLAKVTALCFVFGGS